MGRSLGHCHRACLADNCTASVHLVQTRWFRHPIFVKLELITCPVTAVLIWQQGDYIGSVLALLWPIAINVIEFLLFSTRAIIRDHVGSGLWIGPIQERFMNALGYTRRSKDEVEESWERSDLI
jgi:hypothetical protein